MKPRTAKQLKKTLYTAASYADWQRAAQALDQATGAARWKDEEQTRIFDYAAIRRRLDQLRSLQEKGDEAGLLFALNEGVHGNMGNMGRPELYSRARFGTKRLVTDFGEEMCRALQRIDVADSTQIDDEEKLDFFRRASRCFGRSALLLSGGGTFGYFHIGVLRALIAEDLLPRVISGASAGSLMAAVAATHRRSELPALLAPEHLQIAVTKPAESPRRGLSTLLPRFDLEDIRRHIDRLVPDLTFAEAQSLSGLWLNISVSPAELHQTPRLLNAITSPDVLIRSAVLASCAIPGIYPPVSLAARDRQGRPRAYLQDRKWVDGSLSADVPARSLSRLYGVNHYIVSQVNPFALIQPQVRGSTSVLQDVQLLCYHSAKSLLRTTQDLSDKYGRRWPELRRTVNSLISVLIQEYSGDVNIYPPPGLIKVRRGISQPGLAELAAIIHAGERSAWPKLEVIRNCTQIGRVLDEILDRRDPVAAGAGLRIAGRAEIEPVTRKTAKGHQ